MGGLGTPQAPSMSGGLLGILSGLMSGYQGEKKEQYQEKETKQEDVLKQQQGAQQLQMNQLAMKQTNQQLDQNAFNMQGNIKSGAQADLKSLTQQLIQDPARASDSAFIAKYNQLSAASGQIPEMTKDGKIDVNRLKPGINTLDTKALTQIMGLPAPQRKTILDQYSGVDKSMYTNSAVVSEKDQIALRKIDSLDSHYVRKDLIESRLATVRSEFFNAETNELIPAKTGAYYAAASLDAARGSAVVTTANAAMSRANTFATSVQNVMTRFHASPNGSMGAVRSLLTTSSSQLSSLRTAVDDAEKSLSTDYANVTDPEQLAAATQAVTDAKTALASAVTSDQQLRDSVRGNPQVSAFLGASSSKPAENVDSKGPKIRYSTSGGQPIVSRNGGPWEFLK